MKIGSTIQWPFITKCFRVWGIKVIGSPSFSFFLYQTLLGEELSFLAFLLAAKRRNPAREYYLTSWKSAASSCTILIPEYAQWAKILKNVQFR